MAVIIIAVVALSVVSGALSAFVSSELLKRRQGSSAGSSGLRNAIQRTAVTSHESDSPPVPAPHYRVERSLAVTTAADVRHGTFYQLQHSLTGTWLAKTSDSGTDSLDSATERTFFLEYSNKHSAWSIQSHLRTYLAYELSFDISIDRLRAKSFEMWLLEFATDGSMLLKSKRLQKYVTVGGVGHDQLFANGNTAAEAARWVLLREPSPQCNRGDKDFDVPKKDLLERLRSSCWGPEGHLKAAPQTRSSAAKFSNATVPVFGSPKPLAQLSPKDANDKYDTFIISNRTLHNWAMIDGVEPFLLADDGGNQELVKRVNAGAGIVHKIALQTSGFELHKEPSYEQPTYRGLFDAALRRFPDALAVMYSNSDILYTPSLVETVRSVASYVDRERERMKRRGVPYNVKGWMIVGQRVNHDIPPSWNLDASGRWVDTVEGEFAKQGDLFESDAEDYFIVSRGLFDWMKDIPDFVVGGVAFDNWITNKVNVMASRGEAIEVDGSKTIIAVHQNHGGDPKKSHEHPKSVYNSHLAARNGGWTLGHTADALYATERRAVDGIVTVYDKHRLLYP
jgi:hypothetical protein